MINRRALIVGSVVLGLGGYLVGAYVVLEGSRPDTSTALPNDVPLIRPYSPVVGPKDAPVTIVEFIDPACEACRAFHPIVKQILEEHAGQVRVVMRYADFHPQSEEAIRILEAARIQGVFQIVLDRLFEAQPHWAPHGRSGQGVWTVLNGTGLDIEKAKRDAMHPDIVAILNQDAADVAAVGVTGTPTFYVNRKPLADFGPQQLMDLVSAEVDAL